MRNFSVFRGVSDKFRELKDARERAAALQRYERARNLSDEEVERAIEAALSRSVDKPMSPADEDEQLVSFVWGNNLEDHSRTRQAVRKALNIA